MRDDIHDGPEKQANEQRHRFGNLRKSSSTSRPQSHRTSRQAVAVPSDDRRQRVPSAHGGGRSPARLVEVDVPLGKPVQHFVEGDAPFDARQCRTYAVVRAVAERHVLTGFPADVERVRVCDSSLVPVG